MLASAYCVGSLFLKLNSPLHTMVVRRWFGQVSRHVHELEHLQAAHNMILLESSWYFIRLHPQIFCQPGAWGEVKDVVNETMGILGKGSYSRLLMRKFSHDLSPCWMSQADNVTVKQATESFHPRRRCSWAFCNFLATKMCKTGGSQWQLPLVEGCGRRGHKMTQHSKGEHMKHYETVKQRKT
jgi:hypothetical protein